MAYEVPADADDATREALGFLYGGLICALPGRQLLGLRPVAPETDAFDTERVGLDHLAFHVDDLDAAVAALDELGVAYEDVKDLGAARIVELRDPDGVALELFQTKG